MFQFRRFPAYCYFIHSTLTRYCRAGFPHSEIHGSKDICSSPWLFAACRVLHRLLMPRHSPCALISLTYLLGQLHSCSQNYAGFTEVFAKCCFTLKVPQSIRFKCRFSAAPSVALLAFHSSVQFSRCSLESYTRRCSVRRPLRHLCTL